MGYWPDPTPFEAEDGSTSPSLDALIGGPGAALPGLLLLADPSPARAPAARELAVRVARAWVRTGRRVILADLSFRAPGLHEVLGVPNDEGVADHFAFGTSFRRLAKPVDGGAWSLVPAGPWVEDAGAVLRSPAWRRLLAELADRDATLLAYLPADAPGVPDLADAFGALAVLGRVPALPGIRPFSVVAAFPLGGEQDEPAQESAGGEEGHAGATPRGFAAEEPAAAAESESADAAFERIRLPTDARTREALIADLRYRQRAARMAPPSDAYRRPSLADVDARRAASAAGGAEPGAALGAAGEPPPPPREVHPSGAEVHPGGAVLLGEPPLPRRRAALARRRKQRLVWRTVAVVAALALVAIGALLVRSGLEARRERAAAANGALQVPLPLPQAAAPLPPAPDTVLAWAVSLGEQVRLPGAEQRLRQLQAELPGAAFFISPIVRNEALYYDVLAGPAADSASALALLDSLSAGGRNGTIGELRLAPYAFLLGEFATADSADARVAGLRRLEIPSYTVPVAGPPARFRVYAGAYTGPVDAEVMKQILQSVGEPDVLVPRSGKR